MKQGRYDLQASKISEMMKSSNLDVRTSTTSPNISLGLVYSLFTMFFGLCLMQNAPTQSLLSVVNGILDESIERKNGEIPQVFSILNTLDQFYCLVHILTKAN